MLGSPQVTALLKSIKPYISSWMYLAGAAIMRAKRLSRVLSHL